MDQATYHIIHRYPDDNGQWEWSVAENRWKGNPMTSEIVQRFMKSLRNKDKLTATVNHAVPVAYDDMRTMFEYSYSKSPPGPPKPEISALDRYYAMLFRAFACVSFIVWLRCVSIATFLVQVHLTSVQMQRNPEFDSRSVHCGSPKACPRGLASLWRASGLGTERLARERSCRTAMA